MASDFVFNPKQMFKIGDKVSAIEDMKEYKFVRAKYTGEYTTITNVYQGQSDRHWYVSFYSDKDRQEKNFYQERFRLYATDMFQDDDVLLF